MTTWIKFDTDTGITAPAIARQAILSGTDPLRAPVSAGSLSAWCAALPAEALAQKAFVVSPYGATTITSFTGDVSDDELRTLRACLQFGRPSETATLFEGTGASGTIELFACNGDGTATVHDARLVFPSYGHDVALPSGANVTSMTLATDVWKEALESEMDRLDAIEEPLSVSQITSRPAGSSRVLPAPTRGALSIMEEEARLSSPAPPERLNRSEPHDGDPTGPTSPPTNRL